jgi:uncharacterized protein YbjQ (UPF0145 family)
MTRLNATDNAAPVKLSGDSALFMKVTRRCHFPPGCPQLYHKVPADFRQMLKHSASLLRARTGLCWFSPSRGASPMILTTTPSIEGKTLQEYRGIVVGEAILGANVFRDLFAGLRDIIGGRSGAYEKELGRAREIAFKELQERAQELGANAVVGIDLDYEVVGQNGSMLMVSVSGTAVRI